MSDVLDHLRELSLLWISGNWETRIGVSKVFWGVAESQHLVDTINQTDLAANPDGLIRGSSQTARKKAPAPSGIDVVTRASTRPASRRTRRRGRSC